MSAIDNKCLDFTRLQLLACVLISCLVGEDAAAFNDYQPTGAHVGSFLMQPEIELSAVHDSNIFRLPDGFEESDTYFSVKPSLDFKSDWSRHALSIDLLADLARYQDHPNEDYNDYGINTAGRLDVLRNSYATFNAGFSQLHEDRNSLDSRAGAEITEYTLGTLGLGYRHSFNRMSVGASYQIQKLNYDNVPSIDGGIVLNDDRDRARNEAKLRVGYNLRPQFDIFMEGGVNSVNYDHRLDANGLERSSNGYKVVAGLSMDVTDVLVGDVFAGYLNQQYDDPSFSDGISSSTYGFGLTWNVTRLTTIAAHLDRSTEETTEKTASGYLSTAFRSSIDHELRRNILLSGSLAYTNNDYQQNTPGQKENESIFGAGLGVKYMFTRNFYARAAYDYERRDSDIASQEYKLDRALLSVGARW